MQRRLYSIVATRGKRGHPRGRRGSLSVLLAGALLRGRRRRLERRIDASDFDRALSLELDLLVLVTEALAPPPRRLTRTARIVPVTYAVLTPTVVGGGSP
jgi:hypothetical protein